MNRLYYIFIISLFSCSVAIAQETSFKCILVGEVIDRPHSVELILTTEQGDARVTGVRIPIHEGRFYYELEAEHAEAYALIFADEHTNGAWRPIVFFAEPDTIRMTLYPSNQFSLNTIKGGLLNQQHTAFKEQVEQQFGLYTLEKEMDLLREAGLELTDEAKELRARIQQSENKAERDSLQLVAQKLDKDNKARTPQAQKLQEEYEQKYKDWIEWKSEQVQSQKSLITYRELMVLLQMARTPYAKPLPISVPELITRYEKVYRSAFPDHPYTKAIETSLESLKRIKQGGQYIDFTAPDFEGNNITLSEQIQGKVALIHLWASWCGPCRRKGKEMIPIYEEYKGRGFEVVGIARERDEKWGIQAAEADKYPWLNLLEINDKGNIWRKYGLGNSGGGLFLVDTKGTILAVEPTADEIRELLNNLFSIEKSNI